MSLRGGDDMVMRLRLKHERNTPRERAAEERREHREGKKRRRAGRNLRRARQIRNLRSKGKKKKSENKGKGQGKSSMSLPLKFMSVKLGATIAAKVGLRFVPILGWILLVVDVAMLIHEYGRQSEGTSTRLIQLQDNAITMGDFIPQAAAAAAELAYIESDAGILRAIGDTGKMTGTLMANLKVIRQMAYEDAVGRDMIIRNEYFDSADSMADKLMSMMITHADRADLKAMADRTCHLIRTERAGKGKGK